MTARDGAQIAGKVTDFYFASPDYNGISLEDLYRFSEQSESEFKATLGDLIRAREIDLVYEGDIPNPHIKPFPAPPIEKQLEKLNSYTIDAHLADPENDGESVTVGEKVIKFFVVGIGCCVYPAPERLRKIVDWKKYAARPFDLRLAVGEWQLRPYFFELGILAIYRNDPRYRYETDDTTGSLYAVEGSNLQAPDDIFLKQFGFGFDEHGVRAVSVLLTDLVRLTPEHQRIWQAKMLRGRHRFKLHPDYRKSILGHFPDEVSIFTAFLEELRVINEMSQRIKGVPIFKNIFSYDDKPENFGFLILPTLREYDLFCQTLDRMMSDNLNERFFDGGITPSDLGDGETMENIRGKLIRKLEIWINKTVRFTDHKPKDVMLKSLRDIRALRSKPAHAHFTNKWDLDYYERQRVLVKDAYSTIRILRLIFANHPRSRTVEVPEWLYKGEIRAF